MEEFEYTPTPLVPPDSSESIFVDNLELLTLSLVAIAFGIIGLWIKNKFGSGYRTSFDYHHTLRNVSVVALLLGFIGLISWIVIWVLKYTE